MTEADDSYVLISLGGLALVGLIVQVFFSGPTSVDGSTGPASAAAWGYGLVAVAVACMMFVGFALTTRIQDRLKLPPGKFAWQLVKQSTPLFMLLIVVGWIVGLNVTYWDHINKGEVPAEYTQFATLSSIMIGLEIILILKWLTETTAAASRAARQPYTKEDSLDSLKLGAQGDQMRYVSYLVSALNLVFAGMMTIVLKYFLTDG